MHRYEYHIAYVKDMTNQNSLTKMADIKSQYTYHNTTAVSLYPAPKKEKLAISSDLQNMINKLSKEREEFLSKEISINVKLNSLITYPVTKPASNYSISHFKQTDLQNQDKTYKNCIIARCPLNNEIALIKNSFTNKINKGFKGICGITNKSNNCYIISSVISLAACIPFSHNYHKYVIRMLFSEFPTLLTNLLKSNKTIDFAEFREQLKAVNILFEDNKQHDCFQAMTTILFAAHASCLTEDAIENISFASQNLDARYSIKDFNSLDKSAIKDVFKFIKTNISILLQSSSFIFNMFLDINLLTLKCLTCGDHQLKFEMSLAQSVEVTKSKRLEDSIEQYFTQFIYDDFRCSKCQTPSKVEVSRYPIMFPPIAIFQLKRSTQFANTQSYIKDESKVIYPIGNEPLILHRYIPNFIKNDMKYFDYSNYYLISVVTHTGELQYGHYSSMIFNMIKNVWERHNDEQTYSIKAEQVLTNEAIILIYMREDLFKSNCDVCELDLNKVYNKVFGK